MSAQSGDCGNIQRDHLFLEVGACQTQKLDSILKWLSGSNDSTQEREVLRA